MKAHRGLEVIVYFNLIKDFLMSQKFSISNSIELKKKKKKN